MKDRALRETVAELAEQTNRQGRDLDAARAEILALRDALITENRAIRQSIRHELHEHRAEVREAYFAHLDAEALGQLRAEIAAAFNNVSAKTGQGAALESAVATLTPKEER